MRHSVIVVCVLAVSMAACSTRPREFSARLSAPTADAGKFADDMRLCQVLVRRGFKSDFKQAALQTVVGTGGGLAAGSLTAGLGTTFSSAVGIGSATLVFAGPLIGFGVSRAIRSNRERKYKTLLAACLSEYGYGVEGWDKRKRLTKAEIAAALAAVPTEAAPAPDAVEP